MIVYALKEINTGLFYSEANKDICRLGLKTKFYTDKRLALVDLSYYKLPYPDCKWYTTLSAIEKMYDKPILEIDITKDLLDDTASLFKFKVVPIEIRVVNDEDI